jgi:spermidine synthase
MDTRLYINGNLQFSTIDEHRYHEPIVHIPMAFVKNPENILLLGAGDGLAVREVLKYPEVGHVDVIDLDPVITQLASENPIFTSINNYALVNPKVRVINDDAYNFIQHTDRVYNLVVVDLTDPNSPSVGKLYTKEFYELLKKVVSKDGVVVTQSSSPFFAPKAFWCINRTLESVFHDIVPFNSYMPTFGIWGFNMGFASPMPYLQQEAGGIDPVQLQLRLTDFLEDKKILLQNRCVTAETVPGFFVFDADMINKNVEVNKLDNQVLVEYYEQSWLRWD